MGGSVWQPHHSTHMLRHVLLGRVLWGGMLAQACATAVVGPPLSECSVPFVRGRVMALLTCDNHTSVTVGMMDKRLVVLYSLYI